MEGGKPTVKLNKPQIKPLVERKSFGSWTLWLTSQRAGLLVGVFGFLWDGTGLKAWWVECRDTCFALLGNTWYYWHGKRSLKGFYDRGRARSRVGTALSVSLRDMRLFRGEGDFRDATAVLELQLYPPSLRTGFKGRQG